MPLPCRRGVHWSAKTHMCFKKWTWPCFKKGHQQFECLHNFYLRVQSMIETSLNAAT